MKTRDIGLTMFRIALCFLIVRNMFNYMPYSELLFGVDGMAPFERYTHILEDIGCTFFKYPFEGFFSADFYLWGVIVLCFLYSLGIGKWLTGGILFFAIFNLQMRNHFILDGSDSIILVTLPFLIIADGYKKFSTDFSFKFEDSNRFVAIRKIFAIAFMLQICIVYFSTGLVKLFCEVWANGTALYYVMRIDEFVGSPWNIALTQNAFFVKFSTYMTLAFELLFPFFVLFRPTKYLILFVGVMFHVGIWVFMKIDVFPWIMIATYFVFITDEEYEKCYSFIRRKFQNIKLKPVLPLILFFLFSSGMMHAQEQKHLDKINEIITNHVEEVPGVAVGVIYGADTKTFYKGKENSLKDHSVSSNTLFEIGSITKTMTTFLLSNAVIENKVVLNEPIATYVPELSNTMIGNVSLKELATHTSGLPANPKGLEKKNDPTKNFSYSILLEGLKKTKLKKRGKFRYSNTGMMLIGHILEVVYNKNFQELLEDYLTDSKNMENTLIAHSNTNNYVIAKGHNQDNIPVQQWAFNAFIPAGGVLSNIDDMLKYLQFNLDISNATENDKQELLAYQKTWHTVYFKSKKEVNMLELGWLVNPLSETVNLVWHNGGTNGSSSYIGYIPEMMIGVVVLCNSEKGVDDLAAKIMNELVKIINTKNS